MLYNIIFLTQYPKNKIYFCEKEIIMKSMAAGLMKVRAAN